MTYYTLLELVQTTINALSLGVPCVIRKLPLSQEALDPATQIVVCPGKAETYERFTFTGHYLVAYDCNVVVIAPNTGLQLSNLQTLLDYRQQLVDALQNLQPTNCLKRNITFDQPIDRNLIPENFDYVSFNASYSIWA
jgi:hypothetical protein